MTIKTTLTFLFCMFLCQSMLLAEGHDQLGVQTHFGHKEWNEPLSQMDDIQKLGVGWIRDDLLWRDVEINRGELKIPDFIWAWLKEAKKHDLKVIAVLNGSNNHGYEHPFNEEGFANFARFCARQLKGYVHAFELINEPFGEYRATVSAFEKHSISNGYGWDSKKNQLQDWPKRYLSIINKAADAIEDEAPDQYQIIALGCAPPLNAHLIKLGVSANIDGQVLHPYSHRWAPEFQAYADTPEYLKRDGIIIGDSLGRFTSIMQRLIEIAKANNGPKELWLTEQGWTTYQRVAIKPSRYRAFSELAQAVYAQRRLMECLGINVRFASWYTMRERTVHNHQKQPIDDAESSEGHFGIIRQDGNHKPVYAAIQRIATTMKDWKADPWGSVHLYHRDDRAYVYGIDWDGARMPDPGVPESRAYTFSNGRQRAIALWSTEHVNAELAPRTADVNINSDRVLTAIQTLDMMTGETGSIPFEQTGQQVVIANMPILDHPVFLTLTGDQAAVALTEHKEYFAKDHAWQLTPSKGVNAQWKIEQQGTQNIGILNYELPEKHHGFTLVQTEIEMAEQTPVITFQVNATADTSVIVRAIDSTGQTHQFRFHLPGSEKWSNHKINLNSKSQASWGGANDKLKHYPFKTLAIGIEKVAKAPLQGTICFRNLLLQAN